MGSYMLLVTNCSRLLAVIFELHKKSIMHFACQSVSSYLLTCSPYYSLTQSVLSFNPHFKD